MVVGPERAAELEHGRVFAVADPLAALQSLAREWRRELGCPTVGITGSTGKTSVKDICRAILPRRVHASPENFNTEIGMPLAILAAPPETELLVMEMAMRGIGPDRRALRDRRARRRGDHQHRAGPPRAARHARCDRRGQGGDPPRTPDERASRDTRGRGGAEPAPSRLARGVHVRSRGRRLRVVDRDRGRPDDRPDRDAARRGRSSSSRSPRRTTSTMRSARSRSASRSTSIPPRWRRGPRG